MSGSLTTKLNAGGTARRRKHALAGNGLIVDRARRALRLVAEQFGEVQKTEHTFVTVRTDDGMLLTLSYDPGNYVFSRVYNLTVTAELPKESKIPAGISLSHRGGKGAYYVRKGSSTPDPLLDDLNASLREKLASIDTLSSRVEFSGKARTVTLTPLGGSYVWVLIPPVFKATAFPKGEPDRILDLLRSMRDWTPATTP